jgi:prepilin-type N-terminal cleavage/methylation domain-containing protein
VNGGQSEKEEQAMFAQPMAKRRRGGFTLVESAIAVVIVGVGIVAMLSAMASGTSVNGQARSITQGVFLAQEIREWTMRLPFVDPNHPNANPGPDVGENPQTFINDLDDLMNVTFSPPRDGQGNPIAGLTGWSQKITIEWRDPLSLSTRVYPDGSSDVASVAVTVSLNGRPVYSTSWIVTNKGT